MIPSTKLCRALGEVDDIVGIFTDCQYKMATLGVRRKSSDTHEMITFAASPSPKHTRAPVEQTKVCVLISLPSTNPAITSVVLFLQQCISMEKNSKATQRSSKFY